MFRPIYKGRWTGEEYCDRFVEPVCSRTANSILYASINKCHTGAPNHYTGDYPTHQVRENKIGDLEIFDLVGYKDCRIV